MNSYVCHHTSVAVSNMKMDCGGWVPGSKMEEVGSAVVHVGMLFVVSVLVRCVSDSGVCWFG